MTEVSILLVHKAGSVVLINWGDRDLFHIPGLRAVTHQWRAPVSHFR